MVIREGIACGFIIKSGTRIGENCEIFPGAVLGEKPQDLKYKDEPTTLKIGNNNIIREYCTIHRGTSERGKTVIGNNCMLMSYSHVAHDSVLNNNIILSNSVQVGGHVDIQDNVIVGGATPIHQFCKLGKFSFIGGGYRVVQDIPPYIKTYPQNKVDNILNSFFTTPNTQYKDVFS